LSHNTINAWHTALNDHVTHVYCTKTDRKKTTTVLKSTTTLRSTRNIQPIFTEGRRSYVTERIICQTLTSLNAHLRLEWIINVKGSDYKGLVSLLLYFHLEPPILTLHPTAEWRLRCSSQTCTLHIFIVNPSLYFAGSYFYFISIDVHCVFVSLLHWNSYLLSFISRLVLSPHFFCIRAYLIRDYFYASAWNWNSFAHHAPWWLFLCKDRQSHRTVCVFYIPSRNSRWTELNEIFRIW